MIYEIKKFNLKNGKEVILSSPTENDAQAMLEYMKVCASETDFLLRYPEEWNITIEQEMKFLNDICESNTEIIIACKIDNRIAGSCQLSFNKMIKTKHRANVAIALVKEFWGMGIGNVLFDEMIQIAKNKGIYQLELEYIEGNERAKRLYEKKGFVQVAQRPNAIMLKDKTMLKEIIMINILEQKH